MYLLGKRVPELKDEDINRLIKNEIRESKSLDYKRDLNLEQTSDKKEFLYDITSFYNTEGGCIIFGIEEGKDEKNNNTGIPKSVVGIEIPNVDKLEQKIEDIIKNNSEPSITNVAINCLKVNGLWVLIIGISQVIGMPVMVTLNESNKFYRRKNSGKYCADVYELNQMFMENYILKNKIENFRTERIEAIRNLKIFPTLNISTSFILHLIPFSFVKDRILDFSDNDFMRNALDRTPMFCNGYSSMYNLDGYCNFSSSQRPIIDAYSQVFRNGIYEVYTSKLFGFDNTRNYGFMYSDDFIESLISEISFGLNLFKKLEIEPPVVLCISIVGIKNYVIKTGRGDSDPFITNELILPQILFSESEVEIYPLIKPILDIIWQSVDYSSSPLYK